MVNKSRVLLILTALQIAIISVSLVCGWKVLFFLLLPQIASDIRTLVCFVSVLLAECVAVCVSRFTKMSRSVGINLMLAPIVVYCLIGWYFLFRAVVSGDSL